MLNIEVHGWNVQDGSGEAIAVCSSRRHAVLLVHAEQLIECLMPLAVCEDGPHGSEVRELFNAIDQEASSAQGESLAERVKKLRDGLPVDQN
jgi:hypothetical protein